MLDSSTKLLLHGDDLTDSSLHKTPLTNQGVVVSSDQSKFGGKSLYFDGSSRLLFPSSAMVFGDADFTIDWWEYCTSPNAGARFSSFYCANLPTTWGGILVGYQGKAVYASSILSSWDIASGAQMLSVTPNEWVHWALVRGAGVAKTYRNGILFATTNMAGSLSSDAAVPMAVGDYREGDHSCFIGYIDEFRITQKAVWTDNFTPPNRPYFFLGDIAQITVIPQYLKEQETIHLSWEEAAGEGVTYTLERQVNGGDYEVAYTGGSCTFSEEAQNGWKTVRYRVKPLIDQTQGNYRESSIVRVYRISGYAGRIIGGGM